MSNYPHTNHFADTNFFLCLSSCCFLLTPFFSHTLHGDRPKSFCFLLCAPYRTNFCTTSSSTSLRKKSLAFPFQTRRVRFNLIFLFYNSCSHLSCAFSLGSSHTHFETHIMRLFKTIYLVLCLARRFCILHNDFIRINFFFLL